MLTFIDLHGDLWWSWIVCLIKGLPIQELGKHCSILQRKVLSKYQALVGEIGPFANAGTTFSRLVNRRSDKAPFGGTIHIN